MHFSNGQRDLTAREQQVLELVVDGLSAKEIAYRLQIAPRTVECHIDHLRTKTRSRNRAQLVAVAVQTGLVPMSPTA